MNLVRQVTILLVIHNVHGNTIGGLSTAPNNTGTEEQANSSHQGLSTGSNLVTKQRISIAIDEDDDMDDEQLTSSEILLRTVTSPKFDSAHLSRVKRGRSARKKKCDPSSPDSCRRARKKTKRRRKPKGRRRKKCKRKGKGRKKGCRKSPKSTKKPPPINVTNPLTPGREKCIRTLECPVGHCCARHHNMKICKPMKKEGDICARPRRKNRRNVDRFQMCECEEGLLCKHGDKGNSRLFTCQKPT